MPAAKVAKRSTSKNTGVANARSKRSMRASSVKEEYPEFFVADVPVPSTKSSDSPKREVDDEPMVTGVKKAKGVASSVLVFKKENGIEKLPNKPVPGIKSEGIKEEPFNEKDFINPKWKVELPFTKKARFDLRLVTRRVEELGVKPLSLNLDEILLNSPLSRLFFSKIYGGSSVDTVPPINKKKYAHAYNDFKFGFFNPELNPYLPQRPGYPGLVYRARLEEWPKVLETFVRLDGSRWLYMGTYKMIQAERLSRQEWLDSPESLKKHWPKHICSKDWAMVIRNRIGLREQLGREPTLREYEDADNVGKEILVDDVRDAFDSGAERLQVWVLKCVGYKKEMYTEMIEKFRTWTPSKQEEQPKNKATAAKKRKHEDDEDEPKPKVEEVGGRKSGRAKRARAS